MLCTSIVRHQATVSADKMAQMIPIAALFLNLIR